MTPAPPIPLLDYMQIWGSILASRNPIWSLCQKKLGPYFNAGRPLNELGTVNVVLQGIFMTLGTLMQNNIKHCDVTGHCSTTWYLTAVLLGTVMLNNIKHCDATGHCSALWYCTAVLLATEMLNNIKHCDATWHMAQCYSWPTKCYMAGPTILSSFTSACSLCRR